MLKVTLVYDHQTSVQSHLPFIYKDEVNDKKLYNALFTQTFWNKNETYSSAETLPTKIYSPHEKTKFLNCQGQIKLVKVDVEETPKNLNGK